MYKMHKRMLQHCNINLIVTFILTLIYFALKAHWIYALIVATRCVLPVLQESPLLIMFTLWREEIYQVFSINIKRVFTKLFYSYYIFLLFYYFQHKIEDIYDCSTVSSIKNSQYLFYNKVNLKYTNLIEVLFLVYFGL